MEENMINNEVETEVSVSTENDQENAFDEQVPSGPSKGFVAFVAGTIAAATIAAAVAISKHKKKKADAKSKDEEPIDVVAEVVEENPAETVEAEVVENVKPENKSEKKK